MWLQWARRHSNLVYEWRQKSCLNKGSLTIIKRKCNDKICSLKEKFTSNLNDELFWYSLFFIHPGRHELWFFDRHFDQANSNSVIKRLCDMLRTDRHGLRGIATHIGKCCGRLENIDPYLKGCQTVIFRIIHLHPITYNNQDWVKHLDSNEHQQLSYFFREFNFKPNINFFKNWFEYAPCSINEGPKFSLKFGKSHIGCFLEIKEALCRSNISQDSLRKILMNYYNYHDYYKEIYGE